MISKTIISFCIGILLLMTSYVAWDNFQTAKKEFSEAITTQKKVNDILFINEMITGL